jgi:predicted DNA-binding protein YlxM (UPF0122 family)
MSAFNKAFSSSQLSSRLVLAKGIKKNRSFQNISSPDSLPKITNFSTSPSVTSTLLNRVQRRRSGNSVNIDPKLAAEVIKKYLLPMFENSRIFSEDLQRKHQMGLGFHCKDSGKIMKETNVYCELKLSEKLSNELEKTNCLLQTAQQRVDFFEQEKFEMQSEIRYLKEINETLNINYNSFRVQLNSYCQKLQSYEMKMYMIQKQLEHYKALDKVNQEKISSLSQNLHNERNLNDIRFNL